MGLLDSVLGSVLAGQNQQGGGLDLGNVLGSMLGGGGQQQEPQAGGLNMGALVALAPILMSMLSNNSSQGGLGGLLEKFTGAGAGDAANSWVGSGANQSVSEDQVTQALGPDVISQIAAQLGVGQGQAAGGVAAILPELIDKLTPQGQPPQGGLGSQADITAMLGQLLGGR
ncbi:YidB family protein [Ottowia sp.]|uniref:YidB family protein n=1 Tax=Ottowia sp. TaxID=1898956 RepID=UPI003A83D234